MFITFAVAQGDQIKRFQLYIPKLESIRYMTWNILNKFV